MKNSVKKISLSFIILLSDTFLFLKNTIKIFQLFISIFLLLTLAISNLYSQNSQTYNQSGIYTWKAPAGVTSVQVQAWGGGGGGAGNSTFNDGAGAGGGGAYSTSNITVVPGTTYTLQVGAGGTGGALALNSTANGSSGGDSWFINSSTVLAKGGGGGFYPVSGAAGAAGTGGQAASCVGSTKYSGGNGGAGNNSIAGHGGGGGSSAGSGTIGNNGSTGGTNNDAGGSAPSGGGAGGSGSIIFGSNGLSPGGGGGGSGDFNYGGTGAQGQIVLNWIVSSTIGSNSVAAANVCSNSTNIPIHSFSITNGTITDVSFVTTGNYIASDISNFKLYYTTGNSFSTSNLLATISSPAVAGTQTFPSFSLPIGSATYYLWIVMNPGSTVTDGHTIAVNATTVANVTGTTSGSGNASGTQTFRSPSLSSSLTPVAIASGSTFSYAATSTSSGATFSWTRAAVLGINQATASGTGNVSEVLTNSTLLPVNVTYVYNTTANGCSASQNVVVTVNPMSFLTSPATPATICSGSTFTYTPTCNIIGATYSWIRSTLSGISQLGTTGTGNIIETLVNTTAFPVNVVYTFTTTAFGFNNPGQSVVVTVNPLPVLSNTATPSPICSGTTFTCVPASATSGCSFSWLRPAITGISQTASSGIGLINELLTNTTTAPINVAYTYTATANGCSNSGQNISVTINPLPVLSNTVTPSPICSGTTFTCIPTSATPGCSFFWLRAAVSGINESSHSGTSSINESLTNATTAPVNVVYTFTTTANGCSNTGQTITLPVNPIPILNCPLTPAPICSGNTFTCIPTSATSGCSFSWLRAATSGISQPGNSGTSNINELLTCTSLAPVKVVYTFTTIANGCVNPGQNITFSVNPTPILSSTLTPAAICSGSTFNYTPASNTSGAAFSWTRATTAGISQAGTSGTGNVSEILTNTTTSPVNVTYSYTVTANGCSSNSQNVTVKVNPSPLLSSSTAPPAIISGSAFTYTPTSTISGTSFSWTRATLAGISQAATSGTNNINETLINTTALPVNVTYTYTITANGCSTLASVLVIVEPLPTINNTLTPAPVVSGKPFIDTLTSNTPGTTFIWKSSTGKTGTGNINDTPIDTTAFPITITYTVTATANGVSGNPVVIVLTVYPVPKLSSPLTASVCSSSTFSYTATSKTPGATFTWSRATISGISQTGTSGTGNVSEVLTNTTTSIVNVTYKYTTTANGVSDTAQNVVVTVNPLPVLSNTVTSYSVRSGNTFNYIAASAITGAAVDWSRATVSGISQTKTSGSGNISEVLINTTAFPVNVTYTYTITANSCSNDQNIVVTVKPLSDTIKLSGIASGKTDTIPTGGGSFSIIKPNIPGITIDSLGIVPGIGYPFKINNNTDTTITLPFLIIENTVGGNITDTLYYVLPIYPIPVLSSSLTASVCSGNTFNYTATSKTPAATFTWSRATISGISQAGTSGTGNVSEVLTSTTTAPINVIYKYITTANGVSDTAQNIVITVNPAPIVTEVSSSPSSANVGTGSATISASGGVVPYSFEWLGINETNPTATGLLSGNYIVQVTDGIGCSSIMNITIPLNPSDSAICDIRANGTVTKPSCALKADGAINLTVSPGSSVTYLWTNGSATENIINASQGIYAVNITDPTCKKHLSFEVEAQKTSCTDTLPGGIIIQEVCNTNASIILTEISAALCPTSCDGRISAQVSGITPVKYVWGGTITTSNEFTAACARQYEVIAIDSNGCYVKNNIFVNEQNPVSCVNCSNNPITISLTSTTPSGAKNCNGSAIITASGGSGHYTYQWSGTNQTNPTAYGLCAGNYIVKVTDSNGCSNVLNVIIPLNPHDSISCDILGIGRVTAPTCIAKADGAITLTVSPSTVTYSWSTGSVNKDITGIPSGTYAVDIADNTCTRHFSYNLQGLDSACISLECNLNASITLTQTSAASCADSCNGHLQAVVNGLTPVKYNWGGTITTSNEFTSACAKEYMVIATDTNGCYVKASITVSEQNPVSCVKCSSNPVTISLLSTTASGAKNCNGSATITASGGSGHYTYQWYGTNQTNPTATGLCIGNYMVKASDSNGCSDTLNVVISPTTTITTTTTTGGNTGGGGGTCDITATYSVTSASCGAKADGAITLSVSPSTVTYSWSTASVNEDLINIPEGIYTVGITDSSCTKNLSISVNAKSNNCTDSSTTIPLCNLNASITLTQTSAASCADSCNGHLQAVVNGLTPVKYNWGGTITTSNVFTSACAKEYMVIATDANGCYVSSQINVGTLQSSCTPTPSLSSPLAANICSGSAFNYTARSSTPGATFAWTRAAVPGIAEAAASGTGNIAEVLFDTIGSPVKVTYKYITTANGISDTAQSVVVTVSNCSVTTCPSCDSLIFYFPSTVCVGAAVTFNNGSLGCVGNPTFVWNFGDGSPVSSNPTHIYTQIPKTGTSYPVQLYIPGLGTCAGKTVTINVNVVACSQIGCTK